MKNGIYVYGVIQTSEPKEFGEIGIGGKASKVFTIAFKDLAAVVSKSPLRVYDSLAKEKAIKDLVTHQLVIEKVMESLAILPVKFGTMVEAKDDVIKLLDTGYFLLRNQLRKIDGKIELYVVASWKLPEAAASLYHQSQRIKRKQAEIGLKGDKATLEDKISLGKLVEQKLKNRQEKTNKIILQTLKKEVVDFCQHDIFKENMVFNTGFLVEKTSEELFNKTLNLLDQKLKGTLNFRLVGPLPPYSFSTILFEKISPMAVDRAKKMLGLNGEITKETVNHAYRQLAQKYHPDKNASQGQLSFDLINSSYKLLKNFIEKGFFNVDIHSWEVQR